MKTLTREMRDALTPQLAIDVLRRGNDRFVNNLKANRNLLQQVNETSAGQHPFGIVLSCIDSRTSAELIFDQGLGDIFSCRIAGNILNEDILGSMEFACRVAGAKVIVVLGHSKCGAVKGACDGVELGNLTSLLQKILPAVHHAAAEYPHLRTTDPAFVEHVAARNVLRVKQQIVERSTVLSAMIEQSEIALLGGMYDVDSGAVEFYDALMRMGMP